MYSIDNDDSKSANKAEQAADMECSVEDRMAMVSRRTEPSPELFHPPRLGIIHLLTWIGISAVILKFCMWAKWIDPQLDNNDAVLHTIFILTNSLRVLLITAGLLGIVVIRRARIRGNRGRLQFGHWLVVNLSVVALLYIAMVLSMNGLLEILRFIAGCVGLYVGRSQYVSPPPNFTASFQSMSQLFISMLWLIACVRMKEPFRWKATAGLLALCSAIVSYINFSSFLNMSLTSPPSPQIIDIITLSVIPIIALIDICRHVKRDWLHWLGIAIIMLSSVSGVIQSVAVRFINTP